MLAIIIFLSSFGVRFVICSEENCPGCDGNFLGKITKKELKTDNSEDQSGTNIEGILKSIASLQNETRILKEGRLEADKDIETLKETIKDIQNNATRLKAEFVKFRKFTSDRLLALRSLESDEDSKEDRENKKTVIAFSANTVRSTNPLYNETLVFTKVTINEGEAYNNKTGKFTAPIPGVYIFHDQICLRKQTNFYHAFVVDNQEIARERYFNADPYFPACFTGALTMKLRIGQQLYVRRYHISTHGVPLIDDDFSINMFSGLRAG